MFLNKLTIHCICWGYFLTELSLKRLKRQELSYLPLRNLKTSIKLLNLLNTMKYQNIAIADKQFQHRMEAITKDLEALFKKKEERRGIPEKPITMTQVMVGGYIIFHLIFGFFLAWDLFLDAYPVTHAYESWNVEIRCIRHLRNQELMDL